MKIRYFFPFLAILLVSCEEEIEYKYSGAKEFLVLEAELSTSTSPSCMVSKAEPIMGNKDLYDTGLPYLQTAKVSLSDGTNTYELNNSTDHSCYTNDSIIIEPGNTYMVTASFPKMKTVYSYVTIPSYPDCEFNVYEAELQPNISYIESDPHEFEFIIHDNPNTKDFYRLSVSNRFKIKQNEYNEFGDYVEYENEYYYSLNYLVESKDPVLHWNQIGESDILEYEVSNQANVFNDDMFNGQTKRLKFNVNTIFFADHDYVFELHHITEDTYLYYRSLCYIYEYNDDYTLQPSILHCNIENGAGILSGWSHKSFTHIFKNGHKESDLIY